MARQMKDSGIEWIGEIPEGWETVKIKQLQDLSVENSFIDGDWIESPYITDTGIRYLTTGNVGDGHFKEQGNGYISEETFRELNCKYAYPDDFVIARLNAPYGRACMLPATHPRYVLAVDIVILRTEANKRYLCYITQCEGYQRAVQDEAKGTTMKRISRTNLGNIVLPIAPLAEQQRIAAFLDRKCAEIDAVIERTKATIEEYKKLKQAVITEAVTKGVRGPRPMKDSGIEWIGEIPEEWEIVKMKHLGKCRNGLTYSPENVCDERGTLVLRSSNIQEGKLCFDDNVYVDCQVRDELMVKKGDILICSRNGSRALIGKNALIPADVVASFGAFMMIFRCECPEYVHLVLNSAVFNYYLGTFLTATINQLTADNFNNMQIVYWPDAAEQQEIVKYLEARCAGIDTLIAKKTALLTELETYKKSLIYEYVTGKKEVTA